MSECEVTRQANNVIPPISSTVAGTGVTVLATSTTTSNNDLYSSGSPIKGYYDRYITIVADGGDVYFNFSAANSVTLNSATTGTTAATCSVLKDGVAQCMRLETNEPAHRYLNLKAATGTPNVRVYPSSQPRFTTY